MTRQDEARSTMPVVDAIQVLVDNTADWIVVTNQSSARTWPKLARRLLDLHYNPSTMGGAVSLALGLALAQPQRRVLCVSGDGALLMNLGALVTVAACAPNNLVVCVLDNGRYEVTGGQQLPTSDAKPLDYLALARSVSWEQGAEFGELTAWRTAAAKFLSLPGPSLLRLAVGQTPLEYLKSPTPPMKQQLQQFRAALQS